MYRIFLLTTALLATSTSLAQTKTTPQAFNALLQTYGARAVAYTGKGCADVTLFNVKKADQKTYDTAIKDMLAFQKQNGMVIVKQKMTKTSLERQLNVKEANKKAYTFHQIKNGQMVAFSCYLK